jgi:hypothetical protein
MKELFYDLVGLCIVGGLCWGSFLLGSRDNQSLRVEAEQTSLCYDTPKYEAWVATKGGIKRCFMEQRSYPHRMRASHIEGEEDAQ